MFKKVILRRLNAICGGDVVRARLINVKGLRQITEDLQDKRD